MRVPQKPRWLMWDHNAHYHPFLLEQIPPGARTALDVGCGRGGFARRVALTVPEVVAIDRSPAMIAAATAASESSAIRYVEADLFDADLAEGGFDFVSCLNTLHHLPLRPGLERLVSLVSPGGVLAILGLYRPATAYDYAYMASTGLADVLVGVARHRTQPDPTGSDMPIADWHESLPQITAATNDLLPGARVRRHMYDRYSIVYRRGS